MASQEHLDILKQGVEVWNRWREENPDIRPDLRQADLSWTDLRGAYLSGAYLHEAYLRWTDLRQADLSGAYLSEAFARGRNARETYVLGADLSGADLSGADLSGADLVGASLVKARLDQADLSEAHLGWGTLSSLDLSQVKGLDAIVHLGPTSIGVDTIYLSKGKIPEVFLRGAGVPESLIRYLPSLLAQPFQFYSCFISHSSKDKLFCDRLYADLQAREVRVWYFPEDATWGKTVWGEIDRSIRIYDKLVVICSENSLQSGPVLREIERALQREDREGKNILFPIRIDDYLFDKWEHPRKADVLSKVVGDFRGWDRSADKYDTAFGRLLSALQGDD